MPDVEDSGALITAGLVASQIDGASVPKRDTAHAGGTCRNCGAPLQGAYCHSCGQSAHLHRSLLHLLEEMLHGILHFDTKGWRTLPLLIARPGLLTRRYIDGQRTRYVSPLALFLFSVFLMFFVVSLTNQAPEQDTRATAAAVIDEAGAEASGPDASTPGAQQSEGTASIDARKHEPWSVALSRARIHTPFPLINERLPHALANPELFLYKLKNTAYKLSFMLIPISLPFLWLMFPGRRGVTVYDHAIFSLYSLSFMSILFTVVAVLTLFGSHGWITLLALVIPPVHMFLQLRETYALRFWGALWRTFVLICVAGTAFAVFLGLIALLALE